MTSLRIIPRLQAMIGEGEDSERYNQSELAARLPDYLLPDSAGNQPGDDDYTNTYDLNAAAADIWEEKAGGVAYEFDYSALGASHGRTGKYTHAMNQSRHYRSRARAKSQFVKIEAQNDDSLPTP